MLAQTEKRDGGQAMKARSNDATEVIPPTLSDMGITKDQSANWQTLADFQWKLGGITS